MKQKSFWFSWLLMILLVALPVAAQVTTATITGTVTTDGVGLPGVTVTITSPNMQGSRVTVSGDGGNYVFVNVPPGNYTVAFTLDGMQPVSRSVSVGVAQTGRADAQMSLGSVTEAITVTASAPSVLETPQVSANFDQAFVDSLPIARGVLDVALLAPGVNANTASLDQLSISGGQGDSNLIMVNGVVITENIRGQASDLFIEDAIQETSVLTGSISAEFGRFTGGVVNSITKSGGNEFSGSFRDSVRNPSWTSLTPYPGEVKGIDENNYTYEATLGGFVMRDRLWFFAAGRDSETSTARTTRFTALPYTTQTDELRYEGKLTAQITDRHSLVGSYLEIDATQEDGRFTAAIYDLASLTDREDPESLASLFYNGIVTNNFFVEGRYAQREWEVAKGSGAQTTDLVTGTLLRNRQDGLARFHSPTFCGVCDIESRDNDGWTLKGSYFLSTKNSGSHNFVAGIESFSEHRYANNHQSGSDFRIDVSDVVRANGNVPLLLNGAPVAVILPTNQSGRLRTRVRWTPIFDGANENDLATESIFLNDKWDLNNHWSFNLGLRYDQNDAVDGTGRTVSDDSAISPRLTAVFDVQGNGRHRFTTSYNRYVSKISEGPATFADSSGTPGTIDYRYGGPAINAPGTPQDQLIPTDQALEMLWDWYRANGGIPSNSNPNLALLLPGGVKSVPGYDYEFPNSVTSPYVDEYTFGYSIQPTQNSFVKVDYVYRDWKEFLAFQLDQSTPQTTDFLGIEHDIAYVINTDEISRTYQGFQMQAQWRPYTRLNLGANYTWSELEGNDEQEDPLSGNIGNFPGTTFYTEFRNYENRQPDGYLNGDQRHRAKIWAGYDVPLPGWIGTVNVSALHSYDTGLPYSARTTSFDPTAYEGAPDIEALGYTGSQLTLDSYYFSKRGAFRTDDIHRTDLSLNWGYPLWNVNLFAQADLLNAFNNDGINNLNFVDTVVNILTDFNPYTHTPVEGVDYAYSPTFGQATGKDAYQLPRTYRFSVGIRF